MENRFDSFEQAQIQLDNFVAFYNGQRPHQSLDMNTPSVKFNVAAPTPKDPSFVHALGPQGTWADRRIGGNGVISIAWQQISIGKHRAGQDVDVLITETMVHCLLQR